MTRALLTEMNNRTLNLNVGGSTRQPVMTAYREQALAVAVALAKTGPAAPRVLRGMGTVAKTGDILRDNHYGWFERLGKGVYALSDAGRAVLKEYPELAAALKRKLSAPPAAAKDKH